MCTLNSLAQWARQWQLAISIDKCCILNIGKHVSSHHLSLDNCALPIVVVSNNLSPSAHVNDIAARAHKRANMILRTFVSQDVSLLIRAYLVYVRTVVEYNTVVWSPYAIKDTKTTERVQIRFTKKLPGLRKFSYDERLSRLRLHSLELRRLLTDLVWCYKILFGIVEMSAAEEFFVFSTHMLPN